MAQIGVFYGPEKGSVERVAHKIEDKFGADRVELISVKDCDASELDRFDKVIFGVSTVGKTNWDTEHTANDWDVFETKLKDVNWEGKTVAIYSLGDQLTYPHHFVDAIGWVYDRLEVLKANVVGFCSTDGYSFEDSEGVRDGQFLGLPIDEDTQPDQTEVRISNWVNRLINEFGF